MADDLREQDSHPHAATLRQRYANAIGFAPCTPYAIADAVLKVRDEELEALRDRAEKAESRLDGQAREDLERAQRAEATLDRIRDVVDELHDNPQDALAVVREWLDGDREVER